MTAAQMQTAMRRYIGYPNPDEWPSYRLWDYLQAGLEALNRRVLYHISDDTTTTIVNGTQEYSQPSDAVWIEWIEWNNILLKKTDVDELRERNVKWRAAAAGIPTDFALYSNQIILFPKPNADAVTADSSLTIRYVSAPAEVSANGAAKLNSQDHRIPIYFAAGEWLAVNGTEQTHFERSKAYFSLFDAEADRVSAYYADRRMKR